MESQKKMEFQRDVQCTFFKNWLDTLEKIIDADNLTASIDLRDTASYKFFRAIMNFSLFGVEPNFKNGNPMLQIMLETLWHEVEREIESSLEHCANWCHEVYISKDQKRIIDTIAEMVVAGEKVSNRKVSSRVFGSDSRHDTVRRTQAKYQDRIDARVKELRSNTTQGTVADETKVFSDGNGGSIEVVPEVEDDLPF